MLLKYDVKRLDSVIRDFYNVTGITVCVLDADFNSLALYPKGATDFAHLSRPHRKAGSVALNPTVTCSPRRWRKNAPAHTAVMRDLRIRWCRSTTKTR